MSADAPRRGLGRGLSALLGEVGQEAPVKGGETPRGVSLVPISHLRPHPGQPRRHFDEAALAELAELIAARGLLQPILVRPRPGSGELQIVAGERRWRAAQRARLHEVPVIVRELGDAETLEIALIENVQRQDLNAIEEAEAYQGLAERFGHAQEAIARLVGKSRSHVANLMRLLALPDGVRAMVADGRLSMGHARALVTAPEAAELAEQVVARGLSVRETERLARGAAPRPPRARKAAGGSDADTQALERQLGDLLGLRVSILHGEGGGTVTLGYSTLDQLDMLCQRLSGGTI